jgi:DNA-directed RNA polymerase subunit RPC12/RpoP
MDIFNPLHLVRERAKMIYKCNLCNREFGSLRGLYNHKARTKTHKTTTEIYLYNLDKAKQDHKDLVDSKKALYNALNQLYQVVVLAMVRDAAEEVMGATFYEVREQAKEVLAKHRPIK